MYSAEWQLMQLACAFAKPGRALGRSCAPSGGRVIDVVVAKTKAVPSPSTAAMAVERRMLVCMAVFLASDRSDLDRLDHVAHVAGRLPDRRRRLADAGGLAACRLHAQRERVGQGHCGLTRGTLPCTPTSSAPPPSPPCSGSVPPSSSRPPSRSPCRPTARSCGPAPCPASRKRKPTA